MPKLTHISICLFLTLTLLLSPMTAAFAGGLNPAHVPADAKWVVHVDYESLSNTKFMQQLRQDHPQLTQVIQGWMSKRYGINPPQDLSSATMFSKDYKQYTGTIIFQTDYSADKVEAFLRDSQDYQTTQFQKYKLHTVLLKKQPQESPSGDKEMTVVMVDNSTVILASSVENAEDTLRLLDGEAPSLKGSSSPLLADDSTQAWVYGAALELDKLNDHPVSMPVISQHARITWSFGEQADGKLYERAHLIGKSEEVAERMAKVLEGIVAYETLWAEGNQALSEIVENVEIHREGNTASFYWEGNADQVTAAMQAVLGRVQSWNSMLKS